MIKVSKLLPYYPIPYELNTITFSINGEDIKPILKFAYDKCDTIRTDGRRKENILANIITGQIGELVFQKYSSHFNNILISDVDRTIYDQNSDCGIDFIVNNKNISIRTSGPTANILMFQTDRYDSTMTLKNQKNSLKPDYLVFMRCFVINSDSREDIKKFLTRIQCNKRIILENFFGFQILGYIKSECIKNIISKNGIAKKGTYIINNKSIPMQTENWYFLPQDFNRNIDNLYQELST